ncbi:DEAD/DEAH box helicase [Lutibaculum baratangense]|nr:DEAD/DEAH box helicase [Lutibaculum baratangense]
MKTLTLFSELGLLEPIQKALTEANYETPTPIQAQAIPHLLEGRDLIGIAQTGTGKTAAFSLPILHRLFAGAEKRHPVPRRCRVLILSPTRELAAQILESIETYGKHLKPTTALVMGGVSANRQIKALQRGVDVLVATPGRLADLMAQNAVNIDRVEMFVLDEADRMLDMGFLPEIRRIVAHLPKERQSLFFSATMPKPIADLANTLLKDPVQVAVTPVARTADRIAQRVVHVQKAEKTKLLAQMLKKEPIDRALIFTRTKHGADKLVRVLAKDGVEAQAIHGNKSQNQRERVLGAFRDGSLRALVATDIAARGIDVQGVSHVFNYDLPNEPESYVHRIGRTARAGADGCAVSFCDAEERPYLKSIEKLIGLRIPVEGETPAEAVAAAPARSAGGAPKGGSTGARGSAEAPAKKRRPRRRKPAGGAARFTPAEAVHDISKVPFVAAAPRAGRS